MANTTSPTASSTKPEKPPKKGWFRGLWQQQKSMAYPDHLAELNRDVFRAYKGLFSASVSPKRVERFEDAVIRQNLSEAFLTSQLETLKNSKRLGIPP